MSACYRRITARTAASPAANRVQIRCAAVKFLPLPQAGADRGRRIVLRSPQLRAIETVRTGGEEKIRRCSCAAVGDLVEINGRDGGKSGDRTAEVLVAAGITVVLGVGNRVLYKLALVPLRRYPFFLAQLATFGYSSSINDIIME